jgi:uncharacterized damage-inducible protein DinB
MEPQITPLAAILDLNTDLLLNSIEGISDSEAQYRLPAGGNSIAFLMAHLTDTRHFLASRLGHPLTNPLARYLADAKSIDDIRSWATLDEMRSAWLAISAHLQTTLEALTTADLQRPGAHRFPISDSTPLGLIAFLGQHDSYHLGQIAFLRRQLGKPAMSYTRRQKSASGVVPA